MKKNAKEYALTKNVIAFRRGLFLLGGNENNPTVAATIQAELMNLGFMLDEAAYKKLQATPKRDAIAFYEEVAAWIKATIGDGCYTPLYAGFPQDVMALSDVELFLNTITHYLSGGTFLVNAFTQKRPTAFERPNYKIITVGTQEDFEQIPRDLLSAEQSLAPEDVDVLRWFFANYPADRVQELLPSRIPFKENLCVLVAELKIIPQKMTTTDALRVIVAQSGGDVTLTEKGEKIGPFSRAARRALLAFLESLDLSVEEMQERRSRWLRVGKVLHPGEYAGRCPKTFAAFQRLRNEKVRTWASAVENAPTLDAKLDLLTQRPGEFARRLDSLVRGSETISKLYRHFVGVDWQTLAEIKKLARVKTFRPIVADYFHTLRSPQELEAYSKAHARISGQIAKERQEAGLSPLEADEMAWQVWQTYWKGSPRLADDRRRINAAVKKAARSALYNGRKRRRAWEEIRQCRMKPLAPTTLAKILARFESVADKISPKVLYELYDRFEKRREADAERTVFIKGARRPTSLIPLPALDKPVVDRVQAAIVSGIKGRYATLPPLETCWIDPKLRWVPLPTNMRSVSESLAPTVRGTRIPIGNQDAKVVRFYVHYEDPEQLVDFLDLSASFVGDEAVDFVSWNCGFNKPHGVHSGDLLRATAGAQYIDIVIEEARKKFNYVVVDVRNWSGRANSVGALKPICGFMEREHPQANEIWKPSTVVNSFKLTSKNRATLAAAFDLRTMEYVVLDVDADCNTASQDLKTTLALLRRYSQPPKLSVADLLRWHVEARGGTEVAEKENAKTVFNALDFTKDYVKILKTMFPHE